MGPGFFPAVVSTLLTLTGALLLLRGLLRGGLRVKGESFSPGAPCFFSRRSFSSPFS